MGKYLVNSNTLINSSGPFNNLNINEKQYWKIEACTCVYIAECIKAISVIVCLLKRGVSFC